MAADPRPVKRHKADVHEWALLRKMKLGECRVCLVPPGFGHRAELHHLVGRDLGGDDVMDNLVPLCPDCHRLVEERRTDACHFLRESLTLREYAYVMDKKGVDFLARYYPRRSAEDMLSTASEEA